MLNFLAVHYGTIIVALIIAAVAAAIIIGMVRRKKKNKGTCGSCCGCSMSETCGKG